MLRILRTLVPLLLFSAQVYAQDCDPQCGSQLLRVDIANNVLNNNSAQSLLPALQSLSQSPALQGAIQKEFLLQPFSFPHTLETCQREKAEGDPHFRNIDCLAKDICSNPDYSLEVRKKICFKLPCAILEGDQQVGKCNSTLDLYPTNIAFPTPVNIQNIKIAPTKVEFNNGVANLCFKINELSFNMSTKIDLDTNGTNLADNSIEISNINPVLDGPRDVCVSANVQLGTQNPISNIKITPQGNTPFISDDMIRSASRSLVIKGLSGYKEEDLAAIQGEVVPALFQPMRHSIEKAVQDSLSKVFNDKIQEAVKPLSSGSSLMVDSSSFMSELGINNIAVKNQLARTECAQLAAAKKTIPEKHACIGLPDYPNPISTDFDGSPSIERSILARMVKGANITSENVKQRLIALKDLMREEKVSDFFTEGKNAEEIADLERWHKQMFEDDIKREIEPLIAEIENNQMKEQMFSVVGIQNQINNNGLSSSIGLVIPEICTPQVSPHAGKKMPGCPIQVYADLIEFNKVLEKMWSNGRLCMKGEGEFRPQLETNGRPKYNQEGRPLVNGGCEMIMGGMSCYVKNPPQLKYDSKTKKYKVDLALKSCYRGPVILGIGKFGGDFNINFDFKPKACSNGDFCMDEVKANWSIVPGTERFDLKESSWFDKLIKEKIDSSVKNALKETIRIPMASGVGPLGNIPLQAEGRVDSGPGYFGVCLEVPEGASGQ